MSEVFYREEGEGAWSERREGEGGGILEGNWGGGEGGKGWTKGKVGIVGRR